MEENGYEGEGHEAVTLGQGQPLHIPSAWQLPRALTQRLPLLPCAVALGRPGARPERQPGTPASACFRQTEGWETNRAKPALCPDQKKTENTRRGTRRRGRVETALLRVYTELEGASPVIWSIPLRHRWETKAQDGEGTTQAAQLVKDTAGPERDEPGLWSMCEGTCCQCVWGPWFSPPDGTPLLTQLLVTDGNAACQMAF